MRPPAACWRLWSPPASPRRSPVPRAAARPPCSTCSAPPSRAPTGWSWSRTPPSCSCPARTSCAWKRDLLQAANTGHRGLLTTLHAGGPDEIPARLEAMALAARGAVLDVVRRLIAGGLGAAVHLERGPGGRRVTAVAELAPDERGRTRARLVRAPSGKQGLSATGYVPTWMDRLDPSVHDAFDPSTGEGRS